MKLFTLFPLMGIVSVSASAAPITYDITFSGGGPNPVSGSFIYDSTAAMPFSNFKVVWQGVNFDLTESVGIPFVGSACNTSANNGVDFSTLFPGPRVVFGNGKSQPGERAPFCNRRRPSLG